MNNTHPAHIENRRYLSPPNLAYVVHIQIVGGAPWPKNPWRNWVIITRQAPHDDAHFAFHIRPKTRRWRSPAYETKVARWAYDVDIISELSHQLTGQHDTSYSTWERYYLWIEYGVDDLYKYLWYWTSFSLEVFGASEISFGFKDLVNVIDSYLYE